ncbi:MAG: hypothetical protein N4A35_07275 [Flavobacteriales bacterium]|jgi:hypothetical protein|nr:hypothetical protein [Flavobacteriales bacterium]
MSVKKGWIKNIVYLIYAVFVVFFVLGNADIVQIEKHFFNSDTLYLPSIYVDLFEHHNHFKDFNLNPAPNFFPDMGFHFVLMKLLQSDFKLVALVFAIFQVFGIVVLLDRIGQLLAMPRSIKVLGIGLLFLFFLPAVFSNDFLFSFYFIINSYHLGSFILALWLVVLLYQIEHWFSTLLYTALVFVGVISDKSLIVNFVVPLILVGIVFLILNGKEKQINLKKGMLYAVIGSLLGFAFLKLNKELEWLSIPHTDIDPTWEKIVASVQLFFKQTLKYLMDFSWVSLVFFLAIVSYCLQAFHLVSGLKHKPEFGDLLLFLMINVVLFSPVFIGKITGLDSLRYNYHGVILLVFLLPYTIHKIWKVNERILRGIGGAWTGMIVWGALFGVNIKGVHNYLNLYPYETSLMDRAIDKYQLKKGLATYWKAKKNTMFSKENGIVYNVHEDLKVYQHVSNKTWYLDDVNNKNHQPVFNFFISDNDEMTANILELFPQAEQIYLSETLFIIKTSDFVFDSAHEIVKL